MTPGLRGWGALLRESRGPGERCFRWANSLGFQRAGSTRAMLDALEYRISCINCGHVRRMRVAWLLEHPEFACPQGCGATIASPLAELSELVPVPLRSADTIDLSTWAPKSA